MQLHVFDNEYIHLYLVTPVNDRLSAESHPSVPKISIMEEQILEELLLHI